MAAHSPETDEDDPIVAEYDVYITPENDDNLYLLQYPDRERDKPYNERNQSAPTEMRIKPHTGFLEVDVGFGTGPNFYKQRAVAWGVALNTANESGLKEFGVASGFGKAARMNELSSAQRQPADEATIDDMVQDFDHHVQSGFVRPEQVFGGQIVRPEPRQPTYMLGAFRGKELHLKRLEGVVQMRPQYHHIDAKRQLAKATSARGTESVKLNEPRLIQQTAKTAADGEEMSIAKTSEYLTKASEEQWLRLRHKDEDSEEAYRAYGESIFLPDTSSATPLKSPWTNAAYLDEISKKITATLPSRTHKRAATGIPQKNANRSGTGRAGK